MFTKITVVACLIGLVCSGGLQNPALNLGRYASQGAYGGYNGLGNYGANLANQGGAISHVSVIKEISSRGAYGANNGAYAGAAGLAYNGASGWPHGVNGYNNAAGLPYNGAGHLPYSGAALGGLGAYSGAGYPYSGNLGHGFNGLGAGYPYAGVGNAYAGASYPYAGVGNSYAGAGYPYASAGFPHAGGYAGAGYGGVATSYSNIYNGPLRSNLAGSAYGAGSPLSYGGHGYGNRQVW